MTFNTARVLGPLVSAWAFWLLCETASYGATPAGTEFTYQGRFTDTGSPANGTYDLSFALFDAVQGGVQLGTTITNAGVAISNGYFVVKVDFGANAFDGNARWLQLAARKGVAAFTVFSPRQPLSPSPYALSAAKLTGSLAVSQLPPTVPRTDLTQTYSGTNVFLNSLIATNGNNVVRGAFSGDGYGLSNLRGSAIARKVSTPTPLSGTNYIVDFTVDAAQLTPTADINFLQTTNRPAAGYYSETVWYIQPGVASRTLHFNTNWTPLGAFAANGSYACLSNKLTVVAFSARGPGETNVTYAIARQE